MGAGADRVVQPVTLGQNGRLTPSSNTLRASMTASSPAAAAPRRAVERIGSAARWLAVLAVLGGLLAGCTALAPVNPRIEQVQADAGYRSKQLVARERGKSSDTILLLAFSGGGTRAAALSYGVLEELRRYQVSASRGNHSLLQEVDMIGGVSGGSFTALAYAWLGDRLFTEYESRFLKRNVQGELISRALSPTRWPALASDTYGRSELAADYYDEILFGGATFGDLLKLPTPATLVSGTDISTGARFEFVQDGFDFICSDLDQVRLARAVAASSAVPVVLSPVTFHNYGGNCNAQMPPWVADVADPNSLNRPAGRAQRRYRDIQSLQDSANRPYLHIVDGGVSDNLGVRGMLEFFEELEASPAFRDDIGIERFRHLVVIVVNSRSAPATDWDRSPRPPGVVAQLLQASSVPIDHYTYESVELLKDTAQRWAGSRDAKVARMRLGGATVEQAEAAVPKIELHAIDVSFDAIRDEAERRYFMALPTSFHLPDEAVDRLREVGGRLLRESAGFQALLKAGVRPMTAAPQP